eukprot:m.10712 g.10712  ORF g.10712 m.10712 type:complete len:51 (+) comp5605_c0_seq1:1237-1389(+)
MVLDAIFCNCGTLNAGLCKSFFTVYMNHSPFMQSHEFIRFLNETKDTHVE